MTDRKRRAPRGFESGPCPGCKEGDYHPIGDVCHDCRAKLNRANDLIAQHQAQTDDAWFSYPRYSHWAPGFYVGHVDFGEHDGARKLADAFHQFVLASAKDTFFREGMPYADPELYRKHGRLIRRPRGWRTDHQAEYDQVLLPVKVAAAIGAMDRAIILALTSVAEESYRQGSNLLRQLAVGDMTLDDFEKDTAERVKYLRELREKSAADPIPSYDERAER